MTWWHQLVWNGSKIPQNAINYHNFRLLSEMHFLHASEFENFFLFQWTVQSKGHWTTYWFLFSWVAYKGGERMGTHSWNLFWDDLKVLKRSGTTPVFLFIYALNLGLIQMDIFRDRSQPGKSDTLMCVRVKCWQVTTNLWQPQAKGF